MLRGKALRQQVHALIRQLGHADEAMREAAIVALAGIGGKAVPLLLAALDDDDVMVGLGALQALGDIGEPARDAVPRALTALRAGPGRIRFTAAWALSRLGDRSRTVVMALIAALRDQEPRVRRQAARTLGFLGQAAWEAVGPLREALTGRNGRVRREAAVALVRIGEPAKEGVPILMAALDDGDASDRREAVGALGRSGELAKEAVPALLLLKGDGDAGVRESVEWALGQIQQGPPGSASPGSLQGPSRPRQGIVLGRNSVPILDPHGKGSHLGGYQAMLAVVMLLLERSPGEPASGRGLSKELEKMSKEADGRDVTRTPSAVRDYLRRLQAHYGRLFAKPESGHARTLLPGVKPILRRAKKDLERQVKALLAPADRDRANG